MRSSRRFGRLLYIADSPWRPDLTYDGVLNLLGNATGNKECSMDNGESGTAIYLAGHGSKIKPRLLELQYQRILRYRRAFLKRHKGSRAAPAIFVDFRLPSY